MEPTTDVKLRIFETNRHDWNSLSKGIQSHTSGPSSSNTVPCTCAASKIQQRTRGCLVVKQMLGLSWEIVDFRCFQFCKNHCYIFNHLLGPVDFDHRVGQVSSSPRRPPAQQGPARHLAPCWTPLGPQWQCLFSLCLSSEDGKNMGKTRVFFSKSHPLLVTNIHPNGSITTKNDPRKKDVEQQEWIDQPQEFSISHPRLLDRKLDIPAATIRDIHISRNGNYGKPKRCLATIGSSAKSSSDTCTQLQELGLFEANEKCMMRIDEDSIELIAYDSYDIIWLSTPP